MKKKFEDNVANQIPKTKSDEPALPWKIDEADIAKIDSENQDYNNLVQGQPPLKTRPIFLIALVVAVFVAAIFMIAGVATENDRMKIGISEKEMEAAGLQVNLAMVAAEKTALEHSASQLEKRVGDLSAQKELFTAVLESLTKKPDDIPAVNPTPGTISSATQSTEKQEGISE